MNLLMIARIALRSLRRAFLRSVLTTLGIIIGVATVIAMVGIGNGAKDKVANLLSGADANELYLYAQMPVTDWRTGSQEQMRAGDGILLAAYEAIREKIRGIASISLWVYSENAGKVSANGHVSSPQIEGVNVEGLGMQRRPIVDGTFFGRADQDAAASVCLITQAVAKDLFDQAEPVGRTLLIQKIPFLIIGLLEDDNTRRSNGLGGPARDLSVYVPYTAVLMRLDRRAQIEVGIKAEKPERLHDVQQDVQDLMEERRGARKAEFRTSDVSDFIKSYTSGIETMTLLLATIAGISLLVGGIGIMNILLVSVTERTREIGIRLAIGTRERDILKQFILEAAILSVAGGLMGIGLGVAVSSIMTRFYSWTTHITTGTILGAFVTSAVIGVFFGWYPARKAAQLDPIEALRYE